MHTLICGVTESGKSTLARNLAFQLAKMGEKIIVFDPVGSEWPTDSVIFSDEEEFLGYVSSPEISNAHIFVDEAGEVFTVGKKHTHWLLTRGRHIGFQVYMIVQRPKMIAPTCRTQCSRGYIFRLSPDDWREVAGDFGHSQNILEKPLDKGDFLILSSGQASIKRANIFQLLGKVAK